MHYKYLKFVALSVISLLAFGCSSQSNSLNTSDTLMASTSLQPSSLSVIQQGNITWTPCTRRQFSTWFQTDLEDLSSNAEALQCATLDIPISGVDGTENSNTTIRLAMTRLPATGSVDDKLGTLINIAGGPGESIIRYLPEASKANKKLSTHFDIINYAPRGIAPSTPTIQCQTDISMSNEAWSQSFVAACWDQTPPELLSVLGSDYAMRDIEAIRQAIGEPQISLIGYSYGTHIATLYAEKYPEYLRAGVLDGLVNVAELPSKSAFNQHVNMQKTFVDFVNDCKQYKDCYYNDTSTIKEADQKTSRLFKYVEDNDIRDSAGTKITPNDLTMAISTFLSVPEAWEFLNTLLISIDDKDFKDISDMITQLNDSIYNDAFDVISCANSAPTDNQKSDYINTIREVLDQSTWDNYRYLEDSEIIDACYNWPVAGSDVPHIPILSPKAPPLLLVAQTDDFNTPYNSALTMQKYLNATLLTRNGNGHVISLMNVSECVDNKVVDYLLDPVGFDNREADNLICD